MPSSVPAFVGIQGCVGHTTTAMHDMSTPLRDGRGMAHWPTQRHYHPWRTFGTAVATLPKMRRSELLSCLFLSRLQRQIITTMQCRCLYSLDLHYSSFYLPRGQTWILSLTVRRVGAVTGTTESARLRKNNIMGLASHTVPAL